MNRLALSGKSNSFTVGAVSDHLAVATGTNNPADEFTVIDLDHAPAVEIAKRFKNVNAYTIDGTRNTAYIAQDGHLLVLRFWRPITRDAEIWELFFETR